jgi:hypothetical protein
MPGLHRPIVGDHAFAHTPAAILHAWRNRTDADEAAPDGCSTG